MRILFAFYPLFVEWNHGIALLSAICKQAGIETDLCILYDTKDFLTKANSHEYDAIGFSVTTKRDYQKALPSMCYVRSMTQHQTLLGGTYMPLCPEVPPVDHVCYGEGEDLSAYLMNGDTRIFDQPMVCTDLNALPLPDYDLFLDFPFDRGLSVHDGKKVLPYVSSRGCVERCVFCQVRHQPPGVRIRTRVAGDLSELKELYAPDMFSFHDTLPPYWDPGWRESWGDFRFPFTCYIRADITSDCLGWLVDRGLKGCAFGIESGDEQFRNDILRKRLTDKDIARTVDALKQANIEYYPFFMSHYPGETALQLKATYDMSRAIGGHPITFEYEQLGV